MHIHSYKISFLDKIYSRKTTSRNLSFDELCVELRSACNIKFTSKEDLGCFVGGELTDGKRSSEYLKCRSIITYDIDNYNSNIDKLVNYIEKSLSGKTYIYYTTASSTFENPRMRILLFLSEEIPPANYNILVTDIANSLFKELLELDENRDEGERLCIDKCSYKALYAMYLPCKIDDNFKYKENIGDLIDVSNYLKVNNEAKIKYLSEDDEFNLFTKLAPVSAYLIDDEIVKKVLSQYDCTNADYHSWLNVGIALHHNYQGSETGLSKFIEWSLTDCGIENKGRYKNSSVENVCLNKYRSFKLDKDNKLTFASIIKIVNDQKKIPSKVNLIDEYLNIVPVENFLDIINPLAEICKQRPKNTFENFKIMCDFYNIKISYDIITKQIMSSLNIDNQNNLDSFIVSLMERNNLNSKFATRYINLLAHQNIMNSFKNVLDNVIWDGKDRLNEFYETVTVEDEYKKARDLYLLKWLQQMIYLSLFEGKRRICRNILVFQSSQLGGKSTWIMSLMPDHLCDYIGEGLTLDTNKDMILKAIGQHIIVELGELGQSLSKSSIDAIKAYFGRTKDILNEKYDKHPAKYQRTTSFIGTVNDEIFLKDPTGSTRYLVIPVISLNGRHNIDMLQLYKQIYTTTDYTDFDLTEENREEQRMINERFEQPDVMNELYLEHYKEPCKLKGSWVSALNILRQLGYSGNDRLKVYRNEICRVLRKNKIKFDRSACKYFVELKNNKN